MEAHFLKHQGAVWLVFFRGRGLAQEFEQTLDPQGTVDNTPDITAK